MRIDAHTNGKDLWRQEPNHLGICSEASDSWQVNCTCGGPRHLKVDQEIVNNIVATVEKHPEYALGQINTQLQASLPNKSRIIDSSVSKMLKNQLIIVKKLEMMRQDRNGEDALHDRREYGAWLFNVVNGTKPPRVDLRWWVWLQPMDFKDARQDDSWSSRRAYRRWIERSQFHTHSGCVKQRWHDLSWFLPRCYERGTLQHLIASRSCSSWRWRCNAFIFDNAPCHRFVQADLVDNHECELLPAYRPFLSIAENCFSAWKVAFKRQMSEVHPQLQGQVAEHRHATQIQVGAQNLKVITDHSEVRRAVSKNHNIYTGYDSAAGDPRSAMICCAFAFDLHTGKSALKAILFQKCLILIPLAHCRQMTRMSHEIECRSWCLYVAVRISTVLDEWQNLHNEKKWFLWHLF